MNFKDIWLIASRELRGVLKNKTVLFQIVFLPFIGVFGYTLLMGMMNYTDSDDTKTVKAYSVNTPAIMQEAFEEIDITDISPDMAADKKDEITEGTSHMLVVFPEDFDLAGENVPNVEIWYNSSDTVSLTQYSKTTAVLNMFQPQIFSVNASENVKYDLAKEEDIFFKFAGPLFSMTILMFIFLSVMNLAAESIVGDKERGFLNTMLASPADRGSIAFGKAIGVYIPAIVSGISAFIGMFLSIPKLAEFMELESTVTYSAVEYAALFAATMLTMFTCVSIILIVSALSDTVKQATTVAPFILLAVMLPVMLTMTDSFGDKVSSLGIINFFIPVWNTLHVMQGILSADYAISDLLISCGVNAVFCAAIIWIVGRCFKSERIVNG